MLTVDGWARKMSKRQIPSKERRRADPRTALDADAPKTPGTCDMWGRPVAYDETPGEEEARMLMSLNWLCDLLDHISRNPGDADRLRSDCGEFIGRLSANCRSPKLRKSLRDAATCIESNRHREASAILRAVAV